jgi:quinol monooxygenase YgiN
MVIGTIRIVPLPDRRADVLELLRSIQGPVRAQPGCSTCDIYEEDGTAMAVVLFERWDTQAALEAHLCSEHYRLVLGALELSASPPEVCFDHVSGTEGMELVERVRTSHRERRTRI